MITANGGGSVDTSGNSITYTGIAPDGDAVGVVGELHPAVLVEHDLELPVAGFEFDLSALAGE